MLQAAKNAILRLAEGNAEAVELFTVQPKVVSGEGAVKSVHQLLSYKTVRTVQLGFLGFPIDLCKRIWYIVKPGPFITHIVCSGVIQGDGVSGSSSPAIR